MTNARRLGLVLLLALVLAGCANGTGLGTGGSTTAPAPSVATGTARPGLPTGTANSAAPPFSAGQSGAPSAANDVPTVIVTGGCATRFTIRGNGYTPNGSLRVKIIYPNHQTYPSTGQAGDGQRKATANGELPADMNFDCRPGANGQPSEPEGTFRIEVTDQKTGKVGEARFAVKL